MSIYRSMGTIMFIILGLESLNSTTNLGHRMFRNEHDLDMNIEFIFDVIWPSTILTDVSPNFRQLLEINPLPSLEI